MPTNFSKGNVSQHQTFSARKWQISSAKLAELRAQGVSAAEIAKRDGVSIELVTLRSKEAGVVPQARKNAELLEQKMSVFIKLMYSLKHISEITGVAQHQIRYWMETRMGVNVKEFFAAQRENLLRSNLPNDEVASRLGISVDSVRYARRKLGCPVYDYAKNKRYGKVLNYWKQLGLSVDELAQKFGVSTSTIKRYIRQYNKGQG